jgi:hypothetical protein
MVSADIMYKGVPLTGIKFSVVRAQHQETSSASELSYQCEVIMPDDSIQRDTGWENVISGTPDFTLSPLSDAELQMVARLTAGGATNIVTVGE